jgi:predicted aspartyl protease
MVGMALWMLLAAPAAAAEAPPLTHYEAVSRPPAAGDPALSSALPLAGDGFDRMTVPVRLGASGPFQFLVDTGSDRTSVSRELVRKLGLIERPRATMHSATGSSQVRMAYLPELQTGRRSVRHISAPMLDAADIGADGILGIDSLRSQRVIFDFRQGTLSIHSGDPGEAVEEGAIIVRARRMEGRLVITNAEIDGERVSVVLDSGSALTVGNFALRRRLERRGGISPVGPIDLISVTGAALRGELASTRRLDIGGARLEGLGVVFADAHTFTQLKLDRKPALLLGMNALQGFDQVAIDFAGKTISLVLPKHRKPRRA